MYWHQKKGKHWNTRPYNHLIGWNSWWWGWHFEDMSWFAGNTWESWIAWNAFALLDDGWSSQWPPYGCQGIDGFSDSFCISECSYDAELDAWLLVMKNCFSRLFWGGCIMWHMFDIATYITLIYTVYVLDCFGLWALLHWRTLRTASDRIRPGLHSDLRCDWKVMDTAIESGQISRRPFFKLLGFPAMSTWQWVLNTSWCWGGSHLGRQRICRILL